MNIENTSCRERHLRKVVIALSSPLSLLLPCFGSVASAQPSPAASAPGSGPAPAATPQPSAPAGDVAAQPAAPVAAQPAAPVAAQPAAPVAAQPEPQPVAQPPSSAPPAASAISGAPAATPPVAPSRDEYDGPPLLVGGSGKKKAHVGGYGGPTIAYTRMLGRDGVLVGGEGAVLIDHRFSLGGAGYGFSRTPDGPPAADGRPREFFAGYGGLVIRYAVYSDIPVYASFGVLVGGGALTLAPRNHDDDDGDDGVATRGYFVVQPDISLHANATRWLRFSLTGGYRIATSVDDFGYAGNDLSGVVFGGNVQAGWL